MKPLVRTVEVNGGPVTLTDSTLCLAFRPDGHCRVALVFSRGMQGQLEEQVIDGDRHRLEGVADAAESVLAMAFPRFAGGVPGLVARLVAEKRKVLEEVERLGVSLPTWFGQPHLFRRDQGHLQKGG